MSALRAVRRDWDPALPLPPVGGLPGSDDRSGWRQPQLHKETWFKCLKGQEQAARKNVRLCFYQHPGVCTSCKTPVSRREGSVPWTTQRSANRSCIGVCLT